MSTPPPACFLPCTYFQFNSSEPGQPLPLFLFSSGTRESILSPHQRQGANNEHESSKPSRLELREVEIYQMTGGAERGRRQSWSWLHHCSEQTRKKLRTRLISPMERFSWALKTSGLALDVNLYALCRRRVWFQWSTEQTLRIGHVCITELEVQVYRRDDSHIRLQRWWLGDRPSSCTVDLRERSFNEG